MLISWEKAKRLEMRIASPACGEVSLNAPYFGDCRTIPTYP